MLGATNSGLLSGQSRLSTGGLLSGQGQGLLSTQRGGLSSRSLSRDGLLIRNGFQMLGVESGEMLELKSQVVLVKLHGLRGGNLFGVG